MHSDVLHHLLKAGAEVLGSWLEGDLLISSTEVLDLDEEKYRNGEWLFDYMLEALRLQPHPDGCKEQKCELRRQVEEEIIEGLADHIGELLINDDMLIIWGSGGTRTISNMIGFNGTVWG